MDESSSYKQSWSVLVKLIGIRLGYKGIENYTNSPRWIGLLAFTIILCLTSCKHYPIQDDHLHSTLDEIYHHSDTLGETDFGIITSDSLGNGFYVYHHRKEGRILRTGEYFIVSANKIYPFKNSERRNYRLAKMKLKRYLTEDQMKVIAHRIFANNTW